MTVLHPAFQLTICLLWGITAALLTWYIARVATSLTYVTLADGSKELRKLPLMMRLLLPLTSNFKPLYKSDYFVNAAKRIDKQIITAGYEGMITGRDIIALRILEPAAYGLMALITVVPLCNSLRGTFGQSIQENLPMIVAFFLLYGLIHPGLWLRSTIKQRHLNIQRSLPFTLDLLTLSVEAGMDFMTALQRNVERGGRHALNEEILRVIREIQLGRTRRDALRDMADRINQPDIHTVINALVQADELGVSIGSILRIQSDQMRNKRFERAERLANEAPVKMLVPLVLFIFPCVMLILMLPFLYPMLEPMINRIFFGA